jgi:vancomycin resistance protein YoaR
MHEHQPVRPRRRPTTEPGASEPWPPEATQWNRVPPPPVRSTGKNQSVGWGATLAFLAVAVLIASVATLFILELWLADRVLPGIYVWDLDLGGLTREEALEHLATNFDYPPDRHPQIRYDDQSWPVTPADLGTELDPAATLDAVMRIGHEGDLSSRLSEQFDVLLNGTLVMPIFTYDQGMSTMFLRQISRDVNRPLRNATLSLGDDLSVQVVPGQAGRLVDEDATRQALGERLSSLGGGIVELVVQDSEPLLTDLSATQAQVQQMLSGSVSVTAPGFEPWTIEPATLASWLILRPQTDANGQTTLSVSLDPAHTTRLAEEINVQVTRPASDAHFRFDDASGTLVPIVESVPGQTLDITATVSLIETLAAGQERTASLPLRSIRPALATEDGPKLGIAGLLSEGTTSFAGSTASRIQNIVVGTSQFDGLLIAPGETFSFNRYLGEVTAEQGYEESIIIWGNTTRADVGGGLCQVSSTAFRAAFWAGVPVVERLPHSFRVSYYEPPKGLDATIYSPSVDLKWVNDTGHHILIQTYVDKAGQTVTFRFYGTNPGRTVEIDGPYESNPIPSGQAVYRDDPTLPKGETKQIEWAKDGLDVTIYRIIEEDGIEVQRDTFFSRYRPWQAVYLVGTKETKEEKQKEGQKDSSG